MHVLEVIFQFFNTDILAVAEDVLPYTIGIPLHHTFSIVPELFWPSPMGKEEGAFTWGGFEEYKWKLWASQMCNDHLNVHIIHVKDKPSVKP